MKRTVRQPNSRAAKVLGRWRKFSQVSETRLLGTPSTLQPEQVQSKIKRILNSLAALWHVPKLRKTATVQFSSRLKKAVGRTFPSSGIIRLHAALAQRKHRRLLRAALCHESAHVAARILHGTHAKPHGPEWRSLVKLAGHRPSTNVKCADLLPPGTQEPRRSRLRRYICPVCQRLYLSRKDDSRLRCGSCLEAGLNGRLRKLHQ